MAIELQGGCRVAMRGEGQVVQDGALSIRSLIGRASGAEHISLRILELAGGSSPVLTNATADEVLYVMDGQGGATLDGQAIMLEPDTALYLAPGRELVLDQSGSRPLVLVSSRCPDPEDGEMGETGTADATAARAATASRAATLPVVRLADRRAETTSDRWYKVLVDAALGSEQVTQFVGAIPPGRAPDHFHEYEEVLCILSGTGRLWAGETHAPVTRGSCVFLPRRQVHSLENTGSEELRVLGVFYPAGSPAVAYAAD